MKILPDNFSVLTFLKGMIPEFLMVFRIIWPWILVAVIFTIVISKLLRQK